MKLDFIYKYTAFNKPTIIPEQRNTDGSLLSERVPPEKE
jgi:hypothetical protein